MRPVIPRHRHEESEGAVQRLKVLDRAQVRTCLAAVDVPEVVADTLVRHARGGTVLPAEAYLPWTNSVGAYTRSVAMLGAVRGTDGTPSPDDLYGLKLINAAVSNPARGMERAGGLSFLFDQETGRPRLMAEAGLLSAARTAGYTVVSLRHLGPPRWESVSLLGAGTLARAHVDALARHFPGLVEIVCHDLDGAAATAFGKWVGNRHPELAVRIVDSAGEAVRGATVVVTVTTSARPYIPLEWLAPGAFVAHVSLDDLSREALLGAEAVYVDDVELVADNPRRVLGQLMCEGAIAAPGAPGTGPRLAGTLGDVLLNRVPAVRPEAGAVVSNPFGMAVLDVALLGAVEAQARHAGLGTFLDLAEDR
jgi:ornithine cyclodeaminase